MKRVILTGASDGLGKAFGKLCVTGGVEVVALCRTKPDYKCQFIKCDLASEKQVISACGKVKEKFGEFDAIVHCAAIVGMEKINQITYEKFEKTWKINTISPLFILSQLYDLVVANEADVMTVGTTASAPMKQGFTNQLAYTATKYGLRGGNYNFSLELKSTKSRVMHINLGGMDTKMHEKDYGIKIEDHNAWMNPDEVAKIMMDLLKVPKNIEISEITINRKGRRL